MTLIRNSRGWLVPNGSIFADALNSWIGQAAEKLLLQLLAAQSNAVVNVLHLALADSVIS